MSRSEDQAGGDELEGVDPALVVAAILAAAEAMKESCPDLARRLRELAREPRGEAKRSSS